MLIVNEVYGPVKQGEGRSAGSSVIFLRLSACNLACDWCDTPYTWNFLNTKFVHPEKYDKKKETHKMSEGDVINKLMSLDLDKNMNLVISGGEPMLQQKKLISLVEELKRREPWWVEIETNGTIEPTDEFINLIDQFNCSPKTGNSGPDNLRLRCIVPDALIKIASSGKGTFKFVVQTETDLEEIQTLVAKIGIRPKQIWLMPEGRTTEEQLQRQGEIEQEAKEHGYNFSPRLHVL